MNEYLLKDGLIVDGNRTPPFRGSILIKEGKIHSIFTDEINSNNYNNIIDVKGNIVAPGFIDIHSHSDSLNIPPKETQSKIFQGITTEIVGNCGDSELPGSVNEDNIGEFLLSKSFEKMPINHGFLLGHSTLRSRVVGYDNREATNEELQKMCNFLKEALEGGAFGISLGLAYPTGMFSTTEELVALAKIVKIYEGILSVHMRSEDEEIFEALEEIIYVAEQSRVNLNISHLKLAGRKQWNKSDILLRKIEDARKKDLTITCDQYPYDATSTVLKSVLPNWMHDGGLGKMVSRLKNTDEKTLKDIKNKIDNRGGPDCIRVVNTYGNLPEINGKNIFEISQLMKLTPEETVIKLLKECDGRISAIYHCLSMKDVLNIMKDMKTSVGSDGSSYSLNKEITKISPHPRNFSAFPRFLQMVREYNLMPIEDAIYKITKLPASILNLKHRGELAEGMVADITVFDFGTISDNSTYTDSVVKPSGINHVFIKGVPEILNQKQEYAFQGRLLLKNK